GGVVLLVVGAVGFEDARPQGACALLDLILLLLAVWRVGSHRIVLPFARCWRLTSALYHSLGSLTAFSGARATPSGLGAPASCNKCAILRLYGSISACS